MPLSRPLILLACTVLGIAAPAQAAGPATQPARVTLSLHAAPASQAIADLAKQAGAPIPVVPADLLGKGALPPVTADLAGAPFWEAVRTIGKQTGLEVVANAEEPYPRFQLGLGGGRLWKTPHAVAGPLLIVATDVARSSTIDLGRTKHAYQRDLTVSLVAYAEPGVRLLAVYPEVKLLAAADDLRQSLVPKPDAAPNPDGPESGDPAHGSEGGAMYQSNLVVALACPENCGRKIATLKGTAKLRLATAFQRVEFEDVLKARNLAKSAGAFPVTFKSLKKADNEYLLALSLKREKRSPQEWDHLHKSLYNGQLTLVDAKGRTVAGRATENGGDYNANRIDANLRFVREPGLTDPDAGEPYKLIWDAPTAAKDVELTFELTDVPIPG